MTEPNTSNTTTTTTEGSAPPDWTSSFSPELKGYVETKGFKDPATVVESYLNLEKLQGVPKDRLLKLPEKMDDASMGEIYERLGRPKEAKEYALKAPEGINDEGFLDWAQSQFFDAGLSKTKAEKLATEWMNFLSNMGTSKQTQAQAKFQQEQTELQTEWGAAHQQNIGVAKKAALAFGMQAEQVDALEQVMGHKGTMKFLQNIGAKLGEHGFEGAGQGASPMLTPDAAKYQIKSLSEDASFSKKLLNGDTEARTKWDNLHKMAFGQ